jgi:SAM-dependent methyltransferase
MRWYLRDLAKLALDFFQSIGVFLLKLFGVINFPVPPNSDMRKTSSVSIRHYYFTGLTTFYPIATLARYYGMSFDSTTKVLDFGCGVGRQLLHLTRNYPDAKYFACDVASSAIDFIAKNYPKVDAYVNEFTPPLKYPNGEMDLVLSVSTFSHFDVEMQHAWIKELYRVTKPGGLALLTVEGEKAIPLLAHEFTGGTAAMEEQLRRDGIIYKEYWWLKEIKNHRAIAPRFDTALGLGASYGSTIMSPEFIRRNWTVPGFEVLGIAGGVIDMRQDVVVLRRPLDR